jgi:hypothetical protein
MNLIIDTAYRSAPERITIEHTEFNTELYDLHIEFDNNETVTLSGMSEYAVLALRELFTNLILI